MSRILVIDDDRELQATLGAYLQAAGHNPVMVETAAEGCLSVAPADLILLDLRLPDGDGLILCPLLRRKTRAPIIVLSGCEDEEDRVRALMAGADDYVAKPFRPRELLARIHAHLRRQGVQDVYQVGNLVVDVPKRLVTVDEDNKDLTPIEFALLCCLLRHQGEVVSFSEILQEVWGYQDGNYNQVKVRIHHLRRKLGLEGDDPGSILSVRGVGFTLALPQDASVPPAILAVATPV
ncbi:MAG: response regulator transcription factor [Candidatus Sericytochromatia bacterium]|nr:response regulator transcription factor [Candidatus Sericytochromatia bacterium]